MSRGRRAVTLVLLAASWVTAPRVTDADVAAIRERIRAAHVAETVRDLAEFVARLRGKPFDHIPKIRQLDDEAFVAAVKGGDDRDDPLPPLPPLPSQPSDDEPHDLFAGLNALGLTFSPSDATEGDATYGYYDRRRDRITLRGTELAPIVRYLLVHELTHAWQEQHHDVDALLDPPTRLDQVIASKALYEGDAERAAERWLTAQPPGVRDEVTERIAVIKAGAPDSRFFRAQNDVFHFPYDHGPAFVEALTRRGGPAAIDAAFRDPPSSTEQVLHPERYVARDRPLEIPLPEAHGRLHDSGTMGEIGLRQLVERGAPSALSHYAADGWAGDAYVTWSTKKRVCLDAVIRMETPKDRDDLVAALRSSARPPDRVAPRGADGVTFRACSG